MSRFLTVATVEKRPEQEKVVCINNIFFRGAKAVLFVNFPKKWHAPSCVIT
jgi:hypothetical protein